MCEFCNKEQIRKGIEEGLKKGKAIVKANNGFNIEFTPCYVRVAFNGVEIGRETLDMSDMADEKGVDIIYSWTNSKIAMSNNNHLEKHICPICGKTYYGYGNNAQPIMESRCCDECNYNLVIPARMGTLNRDSFEKAMFGRR